MRKTWLLAALLGCAAPAVANAVGVVHSGYLLDAADSPVQGSGFPLRFRIFDAPTAGSVVWSSGAGACSVEVRQGRYSAVLGDSCGPVLDSSVLIGMRYLEVEANGVTLLPRTVLMPVPVASTSMDTMALKQTLASVGTVNTASNPVDWTQLKNVPADVVAGGNYAAGAGLSLSGRTFAIAPGGVTASHVADASLPLSKLQGSLNLEQTIGNLDVSRLSGSIPLSQTTGTIDASRVTGVSSEVRVPTDSAVLSCDSTRRGSLSFQTSSGQLLVCDGSAWKRVSFRPAELTLSPSTLDFGTIGVTGVQRTLTVQNTGDADASGVSISIPARLTTVSNTCGSTLASQATCTVVVSLDPRGSAETVSTSITAALSGGATKSTAVTGAASAPLASCLQIKTANSALPDGTYWIDPDGAGAIAALQVYCDMTRDTGGWTLVSNAKFEDAGVVAWNSDATLGSPLNTLSGNSWHHSADVINAIPKTNFKAECYASNNNYIRYWWGVSSYRWSGVTGASESWDSVTKAGSSYATSWSSGHYGLVSGNSEAVTVITAHSGNHWACAGSAGPGGEGFTGRGGRSNMRMWVR